jgi:hypothetical protein
MVGAVSSVDDVSGLLSAENQAMLGQLNSEDRSRAMQYAQNFIGNVRQLGGDQAAIEGAQEEFENVLEFTKKAEDMGLNVSQGWTGQQYQQVEQAINADPGLKAQFVQRHEAYTNQTQNKEGEVLKVNGQDLTNATLDIHFGVYGNYDGKGDLNEDGNKNKTFDENAAALNLAENGPVSGNVEQANKGGGGGGGGDETQAADGANNAQNTDQANNDGGTQNASDSGGAGDLLQLLLRLLTGQLDKNHDGKITADEIKEFLQANGVDDATAKNLLKDLIQAAGGQVENGDNASVDDLIKQLAAVAPSDGDANSIDVAKLNDALAKNPDATQQLTADTSSLMMNNNDLYGDQQAA